MHNQPVFGSEERGVGLDSVLSTPRMFGGETNISRGKTEGDERNSIDDISQPKCKMRQCFESEA